MNEVPTPDREDLVKLRDQGYSREQMADYYGVRLSRVKRWIRELKIPAAAQPVSGKGKIRASEGVNLGADYGLTLIEKAHLILGKRMGRDYRGYLLDGRVVRLDILLRAAGLTVPDST